MRETVTVASAAISRASKADLGFVVKTTKKGSDAAREKVKGSGNVTYITYQYALQLIMTTTQDSQHT